MSEWKKDRDACDAATEGPWEVADSCSYRRILRVHGGGVVEPITHCSDGQPDLYAKRDDLEFIARARTRWPAALDRIEHLEHKLGLCRDALRTARQALGDDDRPFICDAIRELQAARDASDAEADRLRSLLTRRADLPNYCEPCTLDDDCGVGGYKLEWDGSTLRCPKCGADALEEAK